MGCSSCSKSRSLYVAFGNCLCGPFMRSSLALRQPPPRYVIEANCVSVSDDISMQAKAQASRSPSRPSPRHPRAYAPPSSPIHASSTHLYHSIRWCVHPSNPLTAVQLMGTIVLCSHQLSRLRLRSWITMDRSSMRCGLRQRPLLPCVFLLFNYF